MNKQKLADSARQTFSLMLPSRAEDTSQWHPWPTGGNCSASDLPRLCHPGDPETVAEMGQVHS